MISVSVEADVKGAMKHLTDVEKKVVRQAAASALNHATKAVKSQVGSRIAKEIGVAVASGRRRLPITHRASKAALWTELIFKNRAFNVAALKPEPRQLKRGGAKFKGGHWPTGFYLKPGHVSRETGQDFPKGIVLRRLGKARYHVEAKKVPIAFAGERILDKFMKRELPILFKKRFDHEKERRLAKLRK